MATVRQYQKYFTPSIGFIRIRWYTQITLFVLMGIITIVLMTVIAARRDMVDPFSSFADLFGDDVWHAALARGFICQEIRLGSQRQTLAYYCAQPSPETTFNGQYLRVSGSKEHEIIFSLTESALTLGDLVVL